ncbi:MAG: Crp/Fnr family transcriptional regulator [Bdellovibrionaceae bacterium]|nr:Crp/Fnr family transcriptional regulator [Pseudobdellovibrionaceae bacterium]MBX3032703.1 Crp/Fnr family transcriptional regulator [Pseudobdellovibrionaceae bacterium]
MERVLFAGNQNSVMTPAVELPFETIELNEGEVLFRQGEVPRGLYYVQSGCLKMVVQRSLARGRTTTPEYVTKLLSPGEYFGYKALVRGGEHRGAATAVKKSTLWMYPRELVQIAIRNASPLIKYLLEQSVSDLENYEKTSQLHYLASVQERIAYQLVLLAEKFGVPSPQGIFLNLKLTRNEFAQLASTINESLSRHLTEFKNEGLVDVNGKEIVIKDIEGLRKKSGNFQVSAS